MHLLAEAYAFTRLFMTVYPGVKVSDSPIIIYRRMLYHGVNLYPGGNTSKYADPDDGETITNNLINVQGG